MPDEKQTQTSQLKKGTLELAVLKLLEQRAMYGYEIVSQLKKDGFLVVYGTLYPLLARLLELDLVTDEWVESPEGRPRKYYELTARGIRYLQEMTKEWQSIVRAMHTIFKR
jgi:PadR family transcriptional regulator PadR